MSESTEEPRWVILDLLGHVRLAGKVSEVEMFGEKMGRLDVPTADGGFLTRYFGGKSVYSMVPVSEQVARDVAKGCTHEPVSPWDYPKQLVAPTRPTSGDYGDYHADREDGRYSDSEDDREER